MSPTIENARDACHRAMATVQTATATIARSRVILDRCVDRALSAQLAGGLKPQRGGVIDRLLAPQRTECAQLRVEGRRNKT